MRLSFLILSFLLFSAAFSHASQVRVVATEHPHFTRLILFFETNPWWRLEEGRRRAQIKFYGEEFDFDLESTSLSLFGDRLEIVESMDEEGHLDLKFSCDCSARVFRISPGVIAIDVIDAILAVSGEGHAEVAEFQNTGNYLGFDRFIPSVLPSTHNASSDFFRERLATGFVSAVSEGVLNAGNERLLDNLKEDVEGQRSSWSQQVLLNGSSLLGSNDLLHERTESKCANLPSLVEKIGATSDPLEDLRRAKFLLLNNAGEVRRSEVQELFWAYVRAGLLLEARQILVDWPEKFSDNDIYERIVAAFNGGGAAWPEDWIECDPMHYMMSFVTGRALEYQPGRLEAAFFALSHPLREQVLDELSKTLSEIGRLDILAHLQRTLRFLDGGIDPMNVLQSKVRADRSSVLDKSSEVGRQLKKILLEGGMVEDSLIDAGISLSLEIRNTPDYYELTDLISISYLRNSEIESALEFWRLGHLVGSNATSPEIENLFFSELAKLETSSAFLEAAFGGAPWTVSSNVRSEVISNILARLERLGVDTRTAMSLFESEANISDRQIKYTAAPNRPPAEMSEDLVSLKMIRERNRSALGEETESPSESQLGQASELLTTTSDLLELIDLTISSD